MSSRLPEWRLSFLAGALALGLLPTIAEGQSINTFAGGGPIGDGKLATEAVLSAPTGVAADANGNIYIVDRQTFRVRRVDASTGSISTVAGGGTSGLGDGGPAIEAELVDPDAITVDRAGNLYITEDGANRIRRVDAATGVITTVAGAGSESSEGIPGAETIILNVEGIAVDDDGNLYYAEYGLHRIRRIDAVTGLVTTIAGTGTPGSDGDGGPAAQAQLDEPVSLTIGPDGDLYLTEWGRFLIRRIDLGSNPPSITTIHEEGQQMFGIEAAADRVYFSAGPALVKSLDPSTGNVTTIAGTGERSFSGDGGPASDAHLNRPWGLAISNESLLIADLWNRRIRAVKLDSGIIRTLAGGGPVGDGGPATAANLSFPTQIALDPAGNLLILDLYRVREVSADEGRIRTIAGDGIAEFAGDGGPASSARVAEQGAVATDRHGNIYIGTSSSRVRRIDAETGMIDTFAGNGTFGNEGDGGPATQASIGQAFGLALDEAGNLYIADGPFHVIRKVDVTTLTITTVAGTGAAGFSGDGGQATDAQLNFPLGLAVDSSGNLFVADRSNGRIRRIELSTGIITTVAGSDDGDEGDGSPAVATHLRLPLDVALDGSGNLYIAEAGAARIRRVDAQTGTISTVSGTGVAQYRGDGGPAVDASIRLPRAIEVSGDGTIYISDQTAGRIRVIHPCSEIGSVELISPPDGATGLSTAPSLAWEGPDRAFRYDILLAKQGDPLRVVASDLTSPSFTPQNLDEETSYLWQVRAKGDPFCNPVSESFSESRTFTVAAACEPAAAPSLASPAGDAILAGPSATLIWNASPGAIRYDVHLGSSFPPPFIASTTGTSFTTVPLVPGTTYHWSIVAHAECDPSLTSQSEIRSFFLDGSCEPAGQFELLEPEDGAAGVGTTTTLSWSSSDSATGYDLFLGTTNPPAIFLPDTPETEVGIAGLEPGRTYFWKVHANTTCADGEDRISPIRSFMTAGTCSRPQGTRIVLTPPGAVGIGQTYSIAWEPARGLDAGGTYVIERSLNPDFSVVLDSQELTGTSATFLAEEPGTHYHRVRPVSRCNPELTGPASASASVSIVPESPNVIFTIEPEAVVSRTGRNLEDLSTTFALENISSEPVTVIIGRAEIDAPPFFRIVDPLGGDAVFVTLAPRQPKSFELRFSGPRADVEAAYQGLVVVNAVGSPVIPYAFVNLKIGDRGAATPQFRLDGEPTEYVYFPGFEGDDANRPPIEVDLHNPGTVPMELGAEVGPEVWLEPEPGWNDGPIPPGGTRTIRLFTRRNRALNGSALPRYTYFTVRTKEGQTARLLVQDNAPSTLGPGRRDVGVDDSSFIIPHVVSDSTEISQIRLTNLGSSAVPAAVVLTPDGSDGFSGSFETTVIVPPNDVVTLTDPLVQVFGQAGPARGQIEVRASRSRLGLLSVSSSLVARDHADAGLTRLPMFRRGDGSRAGVSHQINGLVESASESTHLVLAETSGTAATAVGLTLIDDDGSMIGRIETTVERYGHRSIDDVRSAFGISGDIDAARLLVEVDGGGSVAAIAIIEGAPGYRTILASAPAGEAAAANLVRWSKRGVSNGVTTTLVAPYVVSGRIDDGGAEYQTEMGFQSPPGAPSGFTLRFTDTAGNVVQGEIPPTSGAIVHFRNVVTQLFQIDGPTEGSIEIEGDPRANVYAKLRVNGQPSGVVNLISSISELVTTLSSARPLVVDGLSQSTDPARGARWNLHVREIAGNAGTVTVRLYEAGNRSHPIATKDFAIGPRQRLSLETVFDAMDLNGEMRRKDRTNVLLVLSPRSGSAQLTAVAVEIDNRTGATTTHTLEPATGVSYGGVTTTLVRVVDPETTSQRRRPVARP